MIVVLVGDFWGEFCLVCRCWTFGWVCGLAFFVESEIPIWDTEFSSVLKVFSSSVCSMRSGLSFATDSSPLLENIGLTDLGVGLPDSISICSAPA